jgi:hypothetical protein
MGDVVRHSDEWYYQQAKRLGHPSYITLAQIRDAERREASEQASEEA